jgi:RNA polymerase sigma-70 factor (ECF subfamily)
MTAADLEELASIHQAQLYRFLRYLGAPTDAAEDLVQDTFLAVFQSAGTPDLLTWPPPRQAAFLCGIARNKLMHFFRARARRRETPLVGETETKVQFWHRAFLRESDGFDYLEALRSCLEHLRPRQRDLLDAFYARKQSREEVAVQLGMTPDGIKTLLRRTRAALGDCVERKIGAADAT